MEIRVIAVWDSQSDDPWIAEAWDEWSIDGNGKGFDEALKKCERENAPHQVRVGIVNVPDNFLKNMFESHEVTGKVIDE